MGPFRLAAKPVNGRHPTGARSGTTYQGDSSPRLPEGKVAIGSMRLPATVFAIASPHAANRAAALTADGCLPSCWKRIRADACCRILAT